MNSQIRWLSLVPEDPSIDVDDDEVERWLYAASSALLRQFDSANTNFTLAAHETLIDLTSWGTAAMELIERDDGFRFSCHPLNSIYLQGDDDTGEIDGVFRCFRRTGNRCLATWDSCPRRWRRRWMPTRSESSRSFTRSRTVASGTLARSIPETSRGRRSTSAQTHAR